MAVAMYMLIFAWPSLFSGRQGDPGEDEAGQAGGQAQEHEDEGRLTGGVESVRAVHVCLSVLSKTILPRLTGVVHAYFQRSEAVKRSTG